MSRIEEALRKHELAGDLNVTLDYSAGEVVSPVRSAGGQVSALVVAYHEPHSLLTENFKQTRMVIQNMLPEGRNKLIMFTSSHQHEGKSVASVNFAVAAAQDAGRRVILVDADLRHPQVHELLGMKPARGFCELLQSDAPVDSVVLHSPVPNLSVILAGEAVGNPGELLSTERAGQVFAELREEFDTVIIDTPPVLPVVDMIYLAPHGDGVVFIVEAGKTNRKKIRHAVQLLNNCNATVLGFLLNKGMVPVTGV